MNTLQIYKNVAMRPLDATIMLWHHRRTLNYLWQQKQYKDLYNYIFTTYFIRGEDCGKGSLDPVWKLTGWAPYLWDLELEVTTRCYLKCVMCEHTYWKDKSYLNQDFTLSAYRKILDNIPNLKWINLTGEGSPVLNPDFNEIAKETKRRGIYFDFAHDFVELPDETAESWVKLKINRLYWSIDGCTKETYEKIRIGANFDKVVENVKKLIAYKKKYNSPLPEICFRFCFFKDNIHEVPSVPAFLHSLVDDVKDYGDEPSINIVALLEFEETKDWAVEIAPEVVRITNKESQRLGFTNYWSHVTHIEEEKAPMDYCTFWSEPYIMITGHVVPCCAVMMSNARQKLEKLSFGNVHKKSLKEIWNLPRYKKFRKVVVNPKAPVPEICLGCRAFNTQERAKKYGVR